MKTEFYCDRQLNFLLVKCLANLGKRASETTKFNFFFFIDWNFQKKKKNGVAPSPPFYVRDLAIVKKKK